MYRVIYGIIALVAFFVGAFFYALHSESKTTKENYLVCYSNGYPEVHRLGGEFWCVRRVNNSDQIVPVSSLRR